MGNLYYQFIEVTDFGPYVTKLILGMPREVSGQELDIRKFSVYVQVRQDNGEIAKVPKSFLERDQMVPSMGYRTVTGVYPSDKMGIPADKESRFVTLELAYGPIYPCSSALVADFSNIAGHEFFAVCDYTVTLTETLGEGDDRLGGLVFDRCGGVFCPQRERFRHTVSSYEKLPLRSGYFIPKLHGGKKALIVWLHGAGEGGQDTAIAYAGNKVTALTEDYVQEMFGGAFVFVPQCPTMWMDDGSGEYGRTGRSIYVEALKAAIDEFIRTYEDAIDPDRIYVGGDSNGGFMTMRMLMDYPDFFAAAFPICEAMLDECITEEHIRRMKEIPIWFTHAINDPIVPPAEYAIPTYQRLKAAGAGNVHFTCWDKIVDIHTGFKNEKGEPYEYMGHFSWIPMLNDDCRLDFDRKPVVVDNREVTLLQWLSLQRK